jgi:integrase
MGDLRLPLTDKNIAGLPLADKGVQYRARDTDLAGFFVLVGSRAKSFMIQADLRTGGARQSIRMKVAEAGDLSTRDARAKAKALLGSIADGIDPRAKKSAPALQKIGEIPTLGQAWARYKTSHLIRKNRSAKTIQNYADHVERLLKDWLDIQLSELGDQPRLVADRHEAITQKNGPAIANGAMRSLRAIYNHARKTCRQLPAENPIFAVDWNPEVRRDTALGVRDLPAWFEQLAVLQSPVRREFHLLTVLSGCRPDALKRAALTDLDLSSRILHIGAPKGGEAKAFDIPLSHAMLESIVRLRRLAPVIYPEAAKTWLFPSDAPSGHVEENKEDREKVLSHWGNDLRQSYRTLGQVAGVSDVDMHLLMNHSFPGVNAGYITRSKLMADHLRQQQEKISQLIVGAVVGRGRRPSALLSRWLNAASRAQLAELLSQDPDEVRGRTGSRSAMRKLEIQAARCQVQQLDPGMLDAPSRRLKTVRAA